MANPIFNQVSGSTPGMNPFQNMTVFFQQLNEYKNGLNGDPNQILQNMIQSGRIPQDKLNSAMQAAQQIRRFIH